MAATTTSIVYSTQFVHIGSGASLAPGGVSGSADVSVAAVGTGNLAMYPRCDVALKIACTASIALASNTIALYRRDLNYDSTNDDTAPNASNLAKLAGVFVVPASTTVNTTNYINLTDVTLPGCDCEFYIQNNLGVNVTLGWTLKVTPKTDAFA